MEENECGLVKAHNGLERFFAYARERYQIFLNREAGKPAPWTDDAVLQQFRFCNIFREDDTVTIWFRNAIREKLSSSPDVLLATVLFRWFNRVKAGEAIFTQTMLDLGTSPSFGSDGLTPWEAREGCSTTAEWIELIESSVRNYCGRGPYVTGSYIIKTPNGMDKLTGVLDCVQKFMELRFPWHHTDTTTGVTETVQLGWQDVADLALLRRGDITLQGVWSWLRQFPFMGDFMAYEVVTDLSHTSMLNKAPDILEWANPGPGATRGLGRLTSNNKDFYRPSQKALLNDKMQSVLFFSRDSKYWPQEWPAWDMRTVEHTLCEFDKYERAASGAGRPRQVFRTGG